MTLPVVVANVAADAPLAGAGTRWIGAAALKGGKGYATGPLGQIHYRRAGSGSGTPVLLLHQTPVGLAEYVDIQPALARAGRASIACDNPGFGMSDPAPEGALTISDLADNLAALLDALEVPKAIVAGHHTGAGIAAAFAARHGARTAAVVLHGCPLYTAAESAERLARPLVPSALKEDGSHLSDTFKFVYARGGTGPEFMASVTWATIGKYLSVAESPIYKALFSNDMSQDVTAIKAPTLILTDRGDILHAGDLKVAAIRPDFTLREFSEGGTLSTMRNPQRWADLVQAFVVSQGL